MLFPTKATLDKCPHCVRYVFYILSSLKLQGFGSWKEAGEPNPFVQRKQLERPATHRQEIVDIFEDALGRR